MLDTDAFDLRAVHEELRKEKFSTFNRLHSIYEDSQWISSVATTYPSFPIVANQRCGTWYVNPEIASTESAYFKSTDGHSGRWDFNLRRANLHLIPLIESAGGLILVDSTRRGKRFPDALSKTVPIWCSVVNTAIRNSYNLDNWDISLYTTPKAVSRSEHAQIEASIPRWAEALMKSSFHLPTISKPIRPLWLSPDTQFPILDAGNLDFYPLICVSASKLVEDPGGVERRLGYTYIQGSGDDHELWSEGLDPYTFWDHAGEILACDSKDILDVVQSLVRQKATKGFNKLVSLTPIQAVRSRIMIGQQILNDNVIPQVPPPCSALIYINNTPPTSFPEQVPAKNDDRSMILAHSVPSGKRAHSSYLQEVLPRSVAFARNHFKERPDAALAILCHDGKDFSVGVAIAIIQAVFNDEGNIVLDENRSGRPTKTSLRTKLQWIQSSRPEANPSRATLKWLNEFFMSDGYIAHRS